MDVPMDAAMLFRSYMNPCLPPVDKMLDLPRSERVGSRKTKNPKKKQPQRGLGVAQLEKLRLFEEQSKQEATAHLAIFQSQASLYPSHRPISFRPTGNSNITESSASPKQDGLFAPDQQSRSSSQLRSSMQEVDNFRLLPHSVPYSVLIQSPNRFHVQDGVKKGPSIQRSIGESEDCPSSLLQPLKVRASGTSLPLACYNSSRSSTCSRHYGSSDPDMGIEEHKYVGHANHFFFANESEHVCGGNTDCADPPIEGHLRYPGCLHRPSTFIQGPMVCFPPTSKRMKELSSFQTFLNERAACTSTEEVIQFKRRACAIVQESTNVQSMNCGQKFKPSHKNSLYQELHNAPLHRNSKMGRIDQIQICKGKAPQMSDVGLVGAWKDLSASAISDCEVESPNQEGLSPAVSARCKRLKDQRDPEISRVRDFIKLCLSRDPGTGLDQQEDRFLTLGTRNGDCRTEDMQDMPNADVAGAYSLMETQSNYTSFHGQTSNLWTTHLSSSKLPAAAKKRLRCTWMNTSDDEAQAVDLTLKLSV